MTVRDRSASRGRAFAPGAATRREALIAGFCLCCLPRAGLRAEALAAAPFAMEEVAPGTFVRRGPDTEANPENAGGIGNAGFVIGRDAVAVTDPGGSRADGERLRDAIRVRTDRPIRHVVMTHVHPDHVFGASAFVEDRPAFVGHANLRPALQARGAYYRERLADILGPERAGTVVEPTVSVAERGEIDLGDRRLALVAHPTAHTNCDLSLHDPVTGLLFAGDLLSVGRIPSLDGSLRGWIGEIDRLRAVGAARAVPGHGPTSVEPEPAFAALARYLTTLRDGTRAAIAADVPIEKAVKTVAADERDRWHLFDDYNTRNVTQAYGELEWE